MAMMHHRGSTAAAYPAQELVRTAHMRGGAMRRHATPCAVRTPLLLRPMRPMRLAAMPPSSSPPNLLLTKPPEKPDVQRQPPSDSAPGPPSPTPLQWRELHPDTPHAASMPSTSGPAGGQSVLSNAASLAAARVQALFLPEGFPASVTEDYLEYQLWSVPTHVTGWLSHSLTTSSLLQAVGLSAGPLGTTALAAAVKWIVKDGIGAVGRLLVGGKLGLELDEDPRRWRMIAELVTTVGLALEVATSMYPQHFLLLACSGNFAKAVGKGIGKPAFRVVQTHFAKANNVGAVSAKEEVWEVVGQLGGLAASVLVLEFLENTGSSQSVVGVWAVTQGVHVLLRQRALTSLAFNTLSRKRACLLVSAHVVGLPLPDVASLNRREPLWASPSSLAPHVELGCSLEKLLGSWDNCRSSGSGSGSEGVKWGLGNARGHSGAGVSSTEVKVEARGEGGRLGGAGGPVSETAVGYKGAQGDRLQQQAAEGTDGSGSEAGAHGVHDRTAELAGSAEGWSDVPAAVRSYLQLYNGEQYMLGWRYGRAWVALKPGAGARAVLRALWQAAWLERHAGSGERAWDGCQEGPGLGWEVSASEDGRDGEWSGNNAAGSPGPERTEAAALLGSGRLNSSSTSASSSSSSSSSNSSNGDGGGMTGTEDEQMKLLHASLAALHCPHRGFAAFEREAQEAGWDTGVAAMRLGRVRVAVTAG